jgi:nucleotide-binding universal stress UspA family protein
VGVETTIKFVIDEPAEGISSVAREAEPDLIVMASHGHGEVRHIFVGSVTEDVIRHTGVPVLLVRPPAED